MQRGLTHTMTRVSQFTFAAVVGGAALLAVTSGCGSTPHTAVPVSSPSSSVRQASEQSNVVVEDSSEVRALIREGYDLLGNSRFVEAMETFQQALERSPAHPEAERGLELAKTYLDQGSTLHATINEVQLRREATLAEFDGAISRAVTSMQARRYADARGLVLDALARLERLRQFLAVAEYQERRERAQNMLETIERRREMMRRDE